MARIATYPTTIENLKFISISDLKRLGYLNQTNSGVINWSINGEITSSIRIYSKVNQITFSYNWNEQQINYSLTIQNPISNLGKGTVSYFICPFTLKKCRKLYLYDGYFKHREAIKDVYYESQLRSKVYRELDNQFGAYFKCDKLYSEVYSKHFKKFYNGKETKKYSRLLKLINIAESTNHDSLTKTLYA